MRAGGARMRLYEYEAKAILKKFGIAVPQGRLAQLSDEFKGLMHACICAAGLMDNLQLALRSCPRQ